MKIFIFSLSDEVLFCILFVSLIFIGLIGLFVVRAIDSKRKTTDNEAVGYIAGIIGIVYAILLGFVILYAMNYYQAAQETVENEANTVTQLYRDGQLINDPVQRLKFNNLLQQYLNNAIKLEWPAMNKISIDRKNIHVLNEMMVLLDNHDLPTSNQQGLRYDLFNQIIHLSEVRDRRLHIATSGMITSIEWYSIIIMTMATLIMSLFFVMRLWLHITMIVILSLASAILITLIVSVDAPFAGRATLTPVSLEYELSEIQADVLNLK